MVTFLSEFLRIAALKVNFAKKPSASRESILRSEHITLYLLLFEHKIKISRKGRCEVTKNAGKQTPFEKAKKRRLNAQNIQKSRKKLSENKNDG